MPCRYQILRDGILVCVFEGVYSLEETLAIFQAGLADPAAAGGVNVIIDITGSQTEKSPDQFRRVVQELCRHGRFAGRIGVVARAADPLRYGMARQFAALTSLDGVPMEVFEALSEAQLWLAREVDEDDDAVPEDPSNSR